jgi:chaperonin GroES
MKIRPLNDRVVVKRIEEKETVLGGIIIPDSAKEKPQEGEILAVGPGKRLDDGKLCPLDVKVGDRVLFGKYSGSEVPVKIGGEDVLIMREILGVVES